MAAADDSKLDPAVVGALYLDYADDLKAFLIGVLRNPDKASEALQATFTKALEAGHTARKETLKGWLFRVAYHEAMALRRRQKMQDKALRRLAWNPPQSDEKPDDNLARLETVIQVRAGLEMLSVEQRQVVRMRIYEEKTFATIAAELGAPLGTVLTRMRLALRKLQKVFDTNDCGDHADVD